MRIIKCDKCLNEIIQGKEIEILLGAFWLCGGNRTAKHSLEVCIPCYKDSLKYFNIVESKEDIE